MTSTEATESRETHSLEWRHKLTPSANALLGAITTVAYSELAIPNLHVNSYKSVFSSDERIHARRIFLKTRYHIGELLLWLHPEEEWDSINAAGDERSIADISLLEYKKQGGNMKLRAAQMPPKEYRKTRLFGEVIVLGNGLVVGGSNYPKFYANRNLPQDEVSSIASMFNALGLLPCDAGGFADLGPRSVENLSNFLVNDIGSRIQPGNSTQQTVDIVF
ncbi:MAG TPA: hypothetical protein VMQ52_03210 [Candidatus Saccharimonadales bacterium]|jgi:hypothetical protein|nr:hypothetical protein [Candidatus Saccharimonadales bacterium]